MTVPGTISRLMKKELLNVYLQELCMDMVYSSLCSSEFSERVSFVSEGGLAAKWTLPCLHKFTSFISCASKCIFGKCIMFIFLHRDYVIIKLTFHVLLG